MLYNPNTWVWHITDLQIRVTHIEFLPGTTWISLLGFSGYPTGIVDRLTAPQSRSAWAGQVNNRSFAPPKVSIEGVIGFEKDSNKIHVKITVKALAEIPDIPVINFILTENKLESHLRRAAVVPDVPVVMNMFMIMLFVQC